MSMHKIRIGVLMGGKSGEREVSFNSGRTVCDHLDTMRYAIIPLYQTTDGNLFVLPWSFLHRGKTSDFEQRLVCQAQQIMWDDLKNLIDCVYIAMHGQYAEDGTVQGIFELLKIPYVGSKVFASALGMDKIMQKKFMRMHTINVPNYVVVNPVDIEEDNIALILERMHDNKITFPCIVKPGNEGSSLGVSIAANCDELYLALMRACYEGAIRPRKVLIEEKIKGMEFSCIVLTDYRTNTLLPLPPTEIIADESIGFFDYDQKYMPGKSLQITPARCLQQDIERIQETCVKVMHCLEFTNLGRIDGFLTDGGDIIIIDPNSFAGAAPASFLFKQAAQIGMNHTALINYLIQTELHYYGMTPMIEKDFDTQEQKSAGKIRVAVLLGGSSNEKEISLESGRNVLYKLSPHKYEPIAIFVTDSLQLFRIDERILLSSSTSVIEQEITNEMQIKWSDLPTIADFVFIALHGGQGENGCVQGMLEMLNLPYNGSSVLTSALCMDKYKTNSLLAMNGFDVPANMLVNLQELHNPTELLNQIEDTFIFPIIIKPHDDGCSVLVHKVMDKAEVLPILQKFVLEKKQYALIEECIRGTELTVGVLGNENPVALPPSQVMVQGAILSIEEKFLPGAGENQTPALLPPQTITLIQKTIESVYAIVNCKGYARIDCFYQSAEQSPTNKERIIIIEINTLPGLTPATCIFHQAAEIGLKPMDFIDLIIEYGFKEHLHIRSNNYQEQVSTMLING